MTTIQNLEVNTQVQKYGSMGHIQVTISIGGIKLVDNMLLSGPYEKMVAIANGTLSFQDYLAEMEKTG